MSSVAIFANGTITDFERVRAALTGENGVQVIAANGGAHYCAMLQLTPDLVIGDLDSLDEGLRARLAAAGVRIEAYPRDKDRTDLELALRAAVNRNPERILLFGLLGGRLDQTIANLLLLARPEWGPAQLITVEGPDTAYLVRGGDSLEIDGKPGETVSLIPLSPLVRGVTTQGLRWALNEAELSFGSTLGISNELDSVPAVIHTTGGVLLVVHRTENRGRDS